MDRADVVTCFCRHDGEVLLLHRAPDAETYPETWGTVTGYVEHDDILDTAHMEIREETGIEDVTLIRRGEPFVVTDPTLDREWRVHQFLFDVESRAVERNEETDRAEWTTPTAILRRDTVPDLWRSYDRVRPTPDSIADDDEHGSAYLSIRGLEVLRDEAALAAVRDGSLENVRAVAVDLLSALPSMAALRNRVNRVVAGATSAEDVEASAIAGIDAALEADERAAGRAADMVDGHVLTLSRSGTVLEALRQIDGPVTVAESRPAREGADVAETLATAGQSVRLCTDAAVGQVLASGEIDAVLVGADTVLPDGRVVNKTGTRTAAIVADSEDVPTYVVAAADKVSTEATPHLESGPSTAVYDGPAELEVLNPTFDVTPAERVAGIFTERGVLEPAEVQSIASEFEAIAALQD